MDYLSVTKQHYAQWLSADPALLDQCGELCFYSPERDTSQAGYPQPFDLYGYFSHQTKILTYGNKLAKHAGWLQNSCKVSHDVEVFKNLVKENLGIQLQHDYKYYFTQLPPNMDKSQARQLTVEDYPAYLRFFKAQYPDSDAETWLFDYFSAITAKGYVFGLFINGALVCASDAPEMPYLKESVVELGINILFPYRGNGYAKIVLSAALDFMTDLGKTPIVSCASSNLASQKLIESVGFKKLADVVSSCSWSTPFP
jgi:RimJ/RimL family protein N-acetyltransferase